MSAQARVSAPLPANSVAPTAETGRGPSRGGRGNAFRQEQVAGGSAEPAPEGGDRRAELRSAYAARLSEVSVEIVQIQDQAERQRAARAVLGQAVEVQEAIELGEEVDIAGLPRIPSGNQGPMPISPFPPEWIGSARGLLESAGGTGAAPFGSDSGSLWDAGRSNLPNSGLLDSLSRIGRQGADYGIPGYQTQSDNLASPEATCNVTSMAMVLERLGYTREDLVWAIELKLKKKQEEARLRREGVPAADIPKKLAEIDYSCVMLRSEAWKDRVLQYLRAENGPRRSAGYQKLRGAAQNERQLQTWAGQFRENANMDDLVHFILDLLGLERTAINADGNPRKVLGFVNEGRGGAAPSSERIDAGGNNSWARTKERVKAALEDGGAAMISVRHKGRGQSGTHIVAIQAVESGGIVVDDPFGRMRGDYDAGQRGDAYSSARGGARDRDRKNLMDRNNPEDWHRSASVTASETKGRSNSWSDASVQSMWGYVVLFRRNRSPAGTPDPAATP